MKRNSAAGRNKAEPQMNADERRYAQTKNKKDRGGWLRTFARDFIQPSYLPSSSAFIGVYLRSSSYCITAALPMQWYVNPAARITAGS